MTDTAYDWLVVLVPTISGVVLGWLLGFARGVRAGMLSRRRDGDLKGEVGVRSQIEALATKPEGR